VLHVKKGHGISGLFFLSGIKSGICWTGLKQVTAADISKTSQLRVLIYSKTGTLCFENGEPVANSNFEIEYREPFAYLHKRRLRDGKTQDQLCFH
jgi:hypothetical protein